VKPAPYPGVGPQPVMLIIPPKLCFEDFPLNHFMYIPYISYWADMDFLQKKVFKR
jgi:hypothetical protein